VIASVLFLVVTALAAAQAGSAPTRPSDGSSEEAVCFDKRGNSLDLRRARIRLSNVRRIGRRHYTIQGDKITIGDRPGQRVNIRIYDTFFLTDVESRGSLVLFHADFAGRPYIYWVEKREGDLARNGLLEIEGDSITRGCVGTIWR